MSGTSLINVVASGAFIPDLKVTLGELAAAFAISMPLGISLGYVISRSRYLIKVFEPLLAAIYAIPIILFLPLYVLLLGLGPNSKIALGATISFFPIVLSTIAGFGYVDRALVTAARSMGASDLQTVPSRAVAGRPAGHCSPDCAWASRSRCCR